MPDPNVTVVPTPTPGVAPVKVDTCVLTPVNDEPDKKVKTLSDRTKMR